MKRTLLYPVSALGLLAAALVPSAPALAATPGDDSAAWSTTAPEVYDIGGSEVDSYTKTAATDDSTPTVTVESRERSHEGATLVVRDASSGRDLCATVAPARWLGDVAVASCTLGRVSPGFVHLEAVLVSADGKHDTEADTVTMMVVPQQNTIEVVSFDRQKDVVTLTGNGPAGGRVQVGQGTSGMPWTWIEVPDSGVWTRVVDHPADMGFTSSAYSRDIGREGYAAFSKNGPEQPVVTTRVESRVTVIDVRTAADTDHIRVRAGGRMIAIAERKGDVTSISIPTPAVQTRYAVQAVRGDVFSTETWSPVNEQADPLELDAPTVSSVVRRGAGAVVTIEAKPDATVSITDPAGATVAVRMAGASGTTQLLLASLPSFTDDRLYVSQSRDGLTSDRDDFTVPVG